MEGKGIGAAMKLLSVQVGRVRPFPAEGPDGAEWSSAIAKTAVQGKVWAGPEGLAGDEQSDHRHHGGEFQAINVYPAEHYDFWRLTPGLEQMTGGAFGENFTSLGLTEETVCIGDAFQVGSALLAVTQPRQPCYKFSRRWHLADLKERAEISGRVGWYLRVLKEGEVSAGDECVRVDHPFPNLTVARVFALRRDPGMGDPQLVKDLAKCPALSPGWRRHFQERLSKE